MKFGLFCTLIFFWVVALPNSFARDRNYGDFRFTKSIYRQTGFWNSVNTLYIEKIEMRSSRKLGEIQARRINLALEDWYASLYSEARYCRDPDSTEPWGYKAMFDQVNYAGDTLSVSFDVSGGCYGRHIFAKEAMNFSLRTGASLNARQMMWRHAPLLLAAGARVEAGYAILSREAVAVLKQHNEDVIDEELMASCARFFTTAGFRIWIRDETLMLVPSFQYPSTHCHQEYVIRSDRKVMP